MDVNELSYIVFLVLAPALAIGLWMIVHASWPHRHIRGHMPLMATSLLIIGWLQANWFEVLSPTPEGTLLWAKISYFFVAVFPPTLFIFACSYTLESNSRWEHLRWVLYVLPGITIALTAAAPQLPLVWKAVRFRQHAFFISIHPAYGVWFYAHLVYSHLLDIGGFFLLLRAYIQERHTPKRYSRLLIVGVTLALLANFSHISHIVPFEKDYTPISLALAVILIVLGTLRQRIFDMRPLAALTVVDNLRDAILLLDANGKIVDTNPAAEIFLKKRRSEIIGRIACQLLCDMGTSPECLSSKTDSHADIVLDINGRGVNAERQCLPLLRSPGGALIGRVVSLRDITQRKQNEVLLARQAQHIRALYASAQILFNTTGISALMRAILHQGYKLADGQCNFAEGYFPEIPDVSLPVLLRYPPQKPGPTFLTEERVEAIRKEAFPGKTIPQNGHAVYIVPLSGEERWFGILAFHLEAGASFQSDEQTILENFALTAVSALHNAVLLRLTNQHAITDPLTRIYNRRGFFEKAATVPPQERQSYTIVMVDMDNLKEINDTYGHQVGDMALQKLSEVLRRQIRRQDILSRYGGDEFIILLPRTTIEDAHALAQRLLTAVQSTRLLYQNTPVHLSASMGVAVSFPREDLEACIQRADSALYQAKHGGKNRIVIA